MPLHDHPGMTVFSRYVQHAKPVRGSAAAHVDLAVDMVNVMAASSRYSDEQAVASNFAGVG